MGNKHILQKYDGKRFRAVRKPNTKLWPKKIDRRRRHQERKEKCGGP